MSSRRSSTNLRQRPEPHGFRSLRTGDWRGQVPTPSNCTETSFGGTCLPAPAAAREPPHHAAPRLTSRPPIRCLGNGSMTTRGQPRGRPSSTSTWPGFARVPSSLPDGPVPGRLLLVDSPGSRRARPWCPPPVVYSAGSSARGPPATRRRRGQPSSSWQRREEPAAYGRGVGSSTAGRRVAARATRGPSLN